jgi:orotidine-5'-phosphate decarboxylase
MGYNALTNFCISDVKRPNLSVTIFVIDNNLQEKLLVTNFFQRVQIRDAERNTMLCVGLDTDSIKIPVHLAANADAIIDFNRAIIDATHDLVCCYKPQIAYYSSQGAEEALIETIRYAQSKDVPVLLDAKRGDIGNTAEQYARELFERFNADAITVNPYMGTDTLAPYLSYEDKGIFVLCRTSNPGGADLQNLMLEGGRRVYEQVAHLACDQWNKNNNVGLVVGATQPAELARVREITGDMPFLVPGIGAQGGDINAMMRATFGQNVIVSSSRGVIYASDGEDFAEAARTNALATRNSINAARN